jgi:hypothetical protein
MGFPLPGDIAGYLGKADYLPVAGADRIEDNVGPKTAPVLPYAPAFALESSFPRRGLHCAFGLTLCTIFQCVERGEVLAEDFRRLIAFEAFRPWIPALHHAFRIKHIDGVVRYGFDQQPILPVLCYPR